MRVTLLPCRDCKVLTAPPKVWRRFPVLSERSACRSGRGLCRPCYDFRRATGTLIDAERRTWSRDEVLDEWVLLRGEGHHAAEVADRLGMTPDALMQALVRARRDGDPRAQFDWVGHWRARRSA